MIVWEHMTESSCAVVEAVQVSEEDEDEDELVVEDSDEVSEELGEEVSVDPVVDICEEP